MSIWQKTFVFAFIVLAAAARIAQAESLYNEGSYRPLAGDFKAFRIGDSITVQVLEISSATTSTDTSTKRNNNLNASLSTLLNARQYGGNVSANSSFDGGGTTQRANRLLTTITVTVREILSNGDLHISGDQVLTINDEQHRVKLEGRVRPHDISDGNVVQSTRLADARIDYVGEGDLSDRQRRALWRKIVDWLGL